MNPLLVKYPITFPTLGWEIVAWIEQYLVHGPGDIQGSEIKLDLEECAFICWAYRLQPQYLPDGELNPARGRRLVHRAVYSRSKGMPQERAGRDDRSSARRSGRSDATDSTPTEIL